MTERLAEVPHLIRPRGTWWRSVGVHLGNANNRDVCSTKRCDRDVVSESGTGTDCEGSIEVDDGVVVNPIGEQQHLATGRCELRGYGVEGGDGRDVRVADVICCPQPSVDERPYGVHLCRPKSQGPDLDSWAGRRERAQVVASHDVRHGATTGNAVDQERISADDRRGCGGVDVLRYGYRKFRATIA